LLPDVHFGSPEAGSLDWRDDVYEDDAPDDDGQLSETPVDVVDLLGFDPLDTK
jgi:hypothetical protein